MRANAIARRSLVCAELMGGYYRHDRPQPQGGRRGAAAQPRKFEPQNGDGALNPDVQLVVDATVAP